MDVLIVVDMQNDFITGSLGSDAAKGIVEGVARRVQRAKENGEKVFITFDEHAQNYPTTQEGRNLPVTHCAKGTWGYELAPEIANVNCDYTPVPKRDTFGSYRLIELLNDICRENGMESGVGLNIEICGLCAEICVSVTALMLKAAFPQALITLNPALTSALTPNGLNAAFEVMRACQIKVG